MQYQVLELQLDYEKAGVAFGGVLPTLTLYLPDNSREIDPARVRPTVLICPGGGYQFLSDREAEPIALQFLAADCNAAVLRYSIAPVRFPAALLEVAASVALLRENAADWHVDPQKIVVMGFSAGGHLAASYGTLWNRDFIRDFFGYRNGEHRPNGMILCYPVITAGSQSHAGSLHNLLGERETDPALRELVSCEKQVSADTPPAFIWHTFTDDCVPVENALLMALALAEKKIPTELHVFPRGYHGLSLANETVYGDYTGFGDAVQCWIGMAIRWLKSDEV